MIILCPIGVIRGVYLTEEKIRNRDILNKLVLTYKNEIMKIKKLEEFSKDGFVAYIVRLSHPEIIVNNLARTNDGTEWLELNVMDGEDESLFPVKVIRMESHNGFVLLTTEEYELDLAFQLGQIHATDIDMLANETFGELLDKINESSDDIKSKLEDIKVKNENTTQNLEEVVKNLRGAI